MKDFRFSFFISFILLITACSTTTTQRESSPQATLPQAQTDQLVVLNHGSYKIYYDAHFKLAKYVKYTLVAEKLNGPGKRKDRFIPDPILIQKKIYAAKKSDYTNSGYDKGHLAPSEDFTWSQEVNDKTFYMSNMAPQAPKLNQIAWKQLEEKTRRWACGEKKLIVITGPILEKGLDTLKSGIPIPKHFFKIVIDDTPPRKAVGFIYSQQDKKADFEAHQVEIAQIESKIGERFHDEVPLADKEIFKSKSTVSDWKEARCNKKGSN